jgi:para-aminobenzoate synthetase component I
LKTGENVPLPMHRKWLPVRQKINFVEQKLASICREYDHSCVLISNLIPDSGFKIKAGFGAVEKLNLVNSGSSFNRLRDFVTKNNDWALGHFSYDLKNEIEQLDSKHPNHLDFPDLHFFVPEVLVNVLENGDTEYGVLSDALNFENKISNIDYSEKINQAIRLKSRTSKEAYIARIQKLKEHIHRGDIYEINYCMEFYAESVQLDPVSVFLRLNEKAQAPFSALYRCGDKWLICASPERFLKKTGSRLISQPIKGTRPRNSDPIEDKRLANELYNDPKERSENVMIVDLVRNDLSRIAKKGSVKVEELFGIHSFNTVHQMISTVVAELDDTVHPVDAIRAAFPMGSMTGAPKVRAMQLSEEYEEMRRGLYAGALGYFTPEGDFDFNVVIRSLQYNATTAYLSLMVGSAITAHCDPEKEYAECLLKAEALMEVLR